MVIDIILDRKDGEKYGWGYDPHEFYRDIAQYGEIGHGITAAMDYGTEADVKTALCEYVIRNEYNPDICGYIWARSWLTEQPQLTRAGW